MSRPARFDWPQVVAGDDMRAYSMRLRVGLAEDADPIPITWASMQVRDGDGTTLLDWSTELDDEGDPQGMVLTDGPEGTVTIGPWEATLAPGMYFYDVQVRHADGAAQTLFAGTFEVLAEAPR